MIKERIKDGIYNQQKMFKIIFTLFFVIPSLISLFIEPVFGVFSFVLYFFVFTYLFMENKIIKSIITGIFIIWLLIILPITTVYSSTTFKEITLFILKIIFPFIPYGGGTSNP